MGGKKQYKRRKTEPKRQQMSTRGVPSTKWLKGIDFNQRDYPIKRVCIIGQPALTPLQVWRTMLGACTFSASSDGSTQSGYDNAQLTFSMKAMTCNIAGVSSLTANVPAISDLTNLFQSYRIAGIQLKLTWSGESSPTDIGWGGGANPIFLIAEDPDDAQASDSLELMQYQNVISWHPTSNNLTKYMYIKPKNKTVMYAPAPTGNVPTSYSNTPDWISTLYPDITHYGVKISVMNTSGAPSTSRVIGFLTIQATYNLIMRDIK